MHKNQHKYFLLRHLAVVVAYWLAYLLIQTYSETVWAVSAGLRLSCLMLIPYRYWPAMIVGEFIPNAYLYYENAARFGVDWYVLHSIPPMLVATPIVWWCRSRLGLFPSKRQISLKALALCIGLTAIAWTVLSVITVESVVFAPGAAVYSLTAMKVAGLLVGKYVGILIVVPLVLFAKLEHRSVAWRVRIREMAESRLTMDTLLLLMPTLFVLAWISYRSSEDVRQMLRMVMFLPVAWMTLKHGWRATALGAPFVVFCISLTLISHTKADAIQTEAFVAFAVTCLFALGVQISIKSSRDERQDLDGARSLQLAQESLHRGELRLRQTAEMLEHVFGAMHLTHTTLLDRFRPMLPTSEGQRYYVQAALAQNQVYRLVDAMHPSAWRDSGLRAALNQTIARVLDETNIAYRCELSGRVLDELSPMLQTGLYRLICETVVYVCAQRPCASIQVRLRSGHTNGKRWATVRVEGTSDSFAMETAHDGKLLADNLALKLGASGMALGMIRDHVRIYAGQVHTRVAPGGLRVTALMQDLLEQPVRERLTAPARRQLYLC